MLLYACLAIRVKWVDDARALCMRIIKKLRECNDQAN